MTKAQWKNGVTAELVNEWTWSRNGNASMPVSTRDPLTVVGYTSPLALCRAVGDVQPRPRVRYPRHSPRLRSTSAAHLLTATCLLLAQTGRHRHQLRVRRQVMYTLPYDCVRGSTRHSSLAPASLSSPLAPNAPTSQRFWARVKSSCDQFKEIVYRSFQVSVGKRGRGALTPPQPYLTAIHHKQVWGIHQAEFNFIDVSQQCQQAHGHVRSSCSFVQAGVRIIVVCIRKS